MKFDKRIIVILFSILAFMRCLNLIREQKKAEEKNSHQERYPKTRTTSETLIARSLEVTVVQMENGTEKDLFSANFRTNVAAYPNELFFERCSVKNQKKFFTFADNNCSIPYSVIKEEFTAVNPGGDNKYIAFSLNDGTNVRIKLPWTLVGWVISQTEAEMLSNWIKDQRDKWIDDTSSIIDEIIQISDDYNTIALELGNRDAIHEKLERCVTEISDLNKDLESREAKVSATKDKISTKEDEIDVISGVNTRISDYVESSRRHLEMLKNKKATLKDNQDEKKKLMELLKENHQELSVLLKDKSQIVEKSFEKFNKDFNPKALSDELCTFRPSCNSSKIATEKKE